MLKASGEATSRFASPRIVDGVEMIDAFIAVDGEYTLASLQRAGVVINCLFDGFVTAQVPVDRLEEVSMLNGVRDLEISSRLYPCTDISRRATGVDLLHNGYTHGLPISYDGSGVIVGVIDVGFDYQHRAFRSNDDPSRTRIVRVYSTTDKTGHTAHYNDIIRLPGSVFMDDEIYNLTSDNVNATHGTHTASIAAGSIVNGYGGMAPGADIVLCAVSVLDGSMSAVEVANCVRYIDSYADSVGQPCVISLSVSTPNGQHDGKDYLSRVVSQTMGPGRLFVISAGNDAGRYSYAHGEATQSKPFNLMFKCKNSIGGDSTYYYGGIIADVWIRKQSTNFYYKFHVVDVETGEILWQTEELSGSVTLDASVLEGYYIRYANGDKDGYIEASASYASDGKKYRLDISLHNLIATRYTSVGGVRKSRYAIGVTVYPRRDVTTEVDAWSCNTGSRFGYLTIPVTTMNGEVVPNFYPVPSDSCCIGTYAVGDSTISAGAYAARDSYYSLYQGKTVYDTSVTVGDIASFSSYEVAGAGPTGKALPDICAPGTNVVAAGSRYSYFARGSNFTVMQYDGSYWGVMSGTSMAAPTVAGAIALWLQANPKLSVADVKGYLAESAKKDPYTFGVNRNNFGPNGKLNAFDGMMLIVKAIQPLMGDVNKDGEINISDVTLLIQYLLNDSISGYIDLAAADLNHNGSVNISDVVILIQFVLER